jgi:hypothetical protein
LQRLVIQVANLAGRFRRSGVVVPYAAQSHTNQQQSDKSHRNDQQPDLPWFAHRQDWETTLETII